MTSSGRWLVRLLTVIYAVYLALLFTGIILLASSGVYIRHVKPSIDTIAMHFIVFAVSFFLPLITYIELRPFSRSPWIQILVLYVSLITVSAVADFLSFFAKPYSPAHIMLLLSDDSAAAAVSIVAPYAIYRYISEMLEGVEEEEGGSGAPSLWRTLLIPLLYSVFYPFLSLLAGHLPFTRSVDVEPPALYISIYDVATGLAASALILVLLHKASRLYREAARKGVEDVVRPIISLLLILYMFHYADAMDFFMAPMKGVAGIVVQAFKILLVLASFTMLAYAVMSIAENLPAHPFTATLKKVARRGGIVLIKHSAPMLHNLPHSLEIQRIIDELVFDALRARRWSSVGVLILSRPFSPLVAYGSRHLPSILVDLGGEAAVPAFIIYICVFKLGTSFPREIRQAGENGVELKIYYVDAEPPQIGYVIDSMERRMKSGEEERGEDTRIIVIIDNISDLYAVLGRNKAFNLIRYIASKLQPQDIMIILLVKGAQNPRDEKLFEGLADVVVDV